MNLRESVRRSEEAALEDRVRMLARVDDWLSRLRPAPDGLRIGRRLRHGGRRWGRR
jgi:hypothetical protein